MLSGASTRWNHSRITNTAISDVTMNIDMRADVEAVRQRPAQHDALREACGGGGEGEEEGGAGRRG